MYFPMEAKKVAVIGAGPAGLVATRELLREGHKVVVFEKSDKVGGTWAYDSRVETDLLGLDPERKIVHSSLYKSLRVNRPRHLMRFLDYAFSEIEGGDQRTFPGHEEVLRFLTTFAEKFGLLESIRFGYNVVRVEQMEGNANKWIVEWQASGCDPNMELFEAVVVSTGRYTEPKTASFPGMDKWPGLQMHSHNYRSPEQFKDMIVVVIGAGASAMDISKELSAVTKEVHLALKDPSVEFASRNNTWGHPMIKRAYEDGKVEFHDGCFIDAHAIIHCTGYKCHYPFLKTNGIVSVNDDSVGPLYKVVFPPSLAPRLAFIGLPNVALTFLTAELQSKWVAKVLSGKVHLPSTEEMKASAKKLYHMEIEYGNWLATQSGLPLLEKRWEHLLNCIWKCYMLYGVDFREKCDVDGGLKEVESSSLGREMAIIRSAFSFMLGTVCGVYIAQNYKVPDIKKLSNTGIFFAKHIEENYRKPNSKKDSDD
ncbi:Short transmembrane mitochondrial protein 1 [Dillenia turbinata]|uniref:Flavin-containing monooxygenase n=1 Tax=Dillenia turbinata TaxID=194707 RepID=A0AAN8UVT6_9MAGN